MKLTAAMLTIGTGCTDANAALWLAPLQDACDKFGVSHSAARLASFLANVGVESNGFTALVENLNYSAQGLANTWPFRYAVDSHVLQKIPNALAYQLNRQPEAIANNVYANRMGNGSELSGDGWKNRGQGPIQLTGHDNITAFFKAAGLPLDTDPATLQEPANGAASACFFYSSLCKAFAAADAGDFDGTVKAVNGQAPSQANQGDLRRKRYAAVLPLCQAATKPAPAPKAPTKTTSQPAAQDKS
jgi:putative chitinase